MKKLVNLSQKEINNISGGYDSGGCDYLLHIAGRFLAAGFVASKMLLPLHVRHTKQAKLIDLAFRERVFTPTATLEMLATHFVLDQVLSPLLRAGGVLYVKASKWIDN